MKNVFLVLAAFACFSFSSVTVDTAISKNTEIVVEVPSDCGPDATAIYSSCWSGCVSVNPELTGILSVDISNLGPRKPTQAELQEAQEILDDICNS